MKNKFMSLVLVLIILVGFMPTVNADEVNEEIYSSNITTNDQVKFNFEHIQKLDEGDKTDDETLLINGLYEINYSAFVNGTMNSEKPEESSLSKYIEETNLKIIEDKTTVVIKFNSASMISNLKAEVNGVSKTVKEKREGTEYISMEFEIDSLEDYINLKLTVTTPFFAKEHGVDFKINSITYIGEVPKEEESNKIPDGQYTINGNLYKIGTTDISAASGYFEAESSIKVENGLYTYTIYTANIKMISNISVTVDGKKKEYSTVNEGNLTGISFPINVIESKIIFTCHVDAPEYKYSSDVEFEISLDVSSLKNSSEKL